MWYVIGIITLLIFIGWLLDVAIAALPVLLITIVVFIATFLSFLGLKLHQLASIPVLAQLLKPSIRKDGLEWQIVGAKVEDYAAPGTAVVVSGLLGGIICWLSAGWLIRPSNIVRASSSRSTAAPNVVEICIAIAIVVAALVYLSKPRKLMANPIRRKLTRLKTDLNKDVSGFEELSELDNTIRSISADWGIAFPNDHLNPVLSYLKTNSHEMLTSLTGLNSLIAERLLVARADKEDLEKAYIQYLDILTFYEITTEAINKRADHHLTREIESLYERLRSDELTKSVESRRWAEIHEHLENIFADIKQLNMMAQRYQGTPSTWSEINEDNAYSVLGIPSSATNEQVKTVYKRLASIYHPDSGIVKDETKMKQVNLAYEYIQRTRGFS
jgi:hypothetical protein